VGEPLQWRNEPEGQSDSNEFAARSGRNYYLVRPVNEPPEEYPREHIWYAGHHTNDEWDNGMSIGFYPSVEVAKVAAQAYQDNMDASRKTTLEELIQYKEGAGEYDEVLAELREEYER